MNQRRRCGERDRHITPLLLILIACLGVVGCRSEEPTGSASLSVERGALGEPSDGFPSWAERVVFMLTNRSRCDPVAELASCTECAERDCYGPVQPLLWSHNLSRAARFHSDNLDRGGCSLQHDSPCVLVADIATQYTPGSCNGAPSCACVDGDHTCGSVGTAWNARIGMFAGGASGENIASTWSGDPVNAYQLWIFEPEGSATCGFRVTNGHRYNILNGDLGSVGVGRSGGGSVYTQDFLSSGSPDGLVSGAHYPQTGASIDFWTSWYRGSGPDAARLNVDGTCHDMTLERGTTTNGTYTATVGGLGAGCHQYYFHFTDGGEEVYYPTTGSFGIGCGYDWDPTRPDPCEGCEPDCSGRECGDNGCGGSCGSCSGDPTCNASGQCVCADGRTNCAGNCVNTNRNENHCGGCDIPCAAGEECLAGVCECVPVCDGLECGDDGCDGSCGSCTGGKTCESGQCQCPSGQQDCDGTCTDLSTDRSHCGSCDNACVVGEGCVEGECIEDCDPSCLGQECGDDGCGGSCGSCTEGLVCAATGQCSCDEGALECGEGVCVDSQTDPDNCGGCGMVCGADEACVEGECACLRSCGDRECGDDGCGGSCGLCGDDRLCGGGGQCLCVGALVDCGGACIDVRNDPGHCGGCDVLCLVYELCVAGECSTEEPDGGCAPSCEGRECSDDGCGGSCGECDSNEMCASGGLCLCREELTDCGDNCVDVRSHASHCGGCDQACLPGQRCVGATCVGDADADAGVDAGAIDVERSPLRMMFGGSSCDCRTAGPVPASEAPIAALVLLIGAVVIRRLRAP